MKTARARSKSLPTTGPTRATSGPLWELSVQTSPEAEEALAEWLRERFGQEPVVVARADSSLVELQVYLPEAAQAGHEARRELTQKLDELRACGLDSSPGHVQVRRLGYRDWAESWKKHFRPFVVKGRLLVKPPWSPREPRAGQQMILINPGLSFGTGQHPTTRFCLEQVVAHRPRDRASKVSMLDMGTGSGILALAAARLGYRPVVGLDADPEAIRAARANARLNGLQGSVHWVCADLRQANEVLRQIGRGDQMASFDLICANLSTEVLLAEAERVVQPLQPDGVLAVAGILAHEFAEVSERFCGLGLRVQQFALRQQWACAALMRGQV